MWVDAVEKGYKHGLLHEFVDFGDGRVQALRSRRKVCGLEV